MRILFCIAILLLTSCSRDSKSNQEIANPAASPAVEQAEAPSIEGDWYTFDSTGSPGYQGSGIQYFFRTDYYCTVGFFKTGTTYGATFHTCGPITKTKDYYFLGVDDSTEERGRIWFSEIIPNSWITVRKDRANPRLAQRGLIAKHLSPEYTSLKKSTRTPASAKGKK